MMKFQRIARNLTRACLISSSIFSNKKKDKIHFHERQLHEIFKEITMEKRLFAKYHSFYTLN